MKSQETGKSLPSLMLQDRGIFICPACGGGLNVSTEGPIRCAKCERAFLCEEGIPLLFWPNEWGDSKEDVTDTIKPFYEDNPFPNYDDLDSSQSLRAKAQKILIARLLDEQIPYGSRVLEVGCGTGQLSNFLGTTEGRSVFATDICLNSLKSGQRFKQRNSVDRVAFIQMNLFRPVFKPECFRLVICSGVLHHTSDPFLGFQSISRLVEKGGFILLGLYNRYGRIPTDMRRFIFRISGNRFTYLDSRLRDRKLSSPKRATWFMDQYKNPHESEHTVDEVLRWFDMAGFEFTNSIPKLTGFGSFSAEEKLFEPKSRGSQLDHFFIQLGMLLRGGREGGFFMMICQRKRQ